MADHIFSDASLSSAARASYEVNGYHPRTRAFAENEAAKFCDLFWSFQNGYGEALRGLLPREQRAIMTETHFFLRWVFDLVSHPRVLDAVSSVIGPDVLLWSTQWFPKLAHDKAYVSWHQDAAYWGLTPPKVTTAWIALTEATQENGCLRVVPQTHKTVLEQRETYAKDNMLSRGQEIAVEVSESEAVNLVLRPGEFSLHHVGIVHGSLANDSNSPRVGIAARYIAPEVVQGGDARDIAMIVRGMDRYGHFDIAAPPNSDMPLEDCAVRKEALARKLSNLGKGMKEIQT